MNALIVEDDKADANFVAATLKANGFSCECVHSGEDGLLALATSAFDIAIVDIVLGAGMTGLELIKLIRARKIKTPIIVLSGKNQPADKIEGLKAGADDYLGKPFARDELLARIDAILRRAIYTNDSRTINLRDLSICIETREVRRGSTIINLTAGEYALLEYMARNIGRTLTTRMILREVWDVDALPSSKIVESRIFSLRKKLSPNKEPNLIFTVRGFGYALR